MVFKKGLSGNPAGRAKGTGIKPLLEAIKTVEKKKKQKFFERAVEMAWTQPTVMNGILKKLVPDLFAGEVEPTGWVEIVKKAMAEK